MSSEENYDIKKFSRRSDRTVLTDPKTMGFFNNREEGKPIRKDKISEKTKIYKGAERNYVPKIHFENEAADVLPILPGNVFPINPNEDRNSVHKDDSHLSFFFFFSMVY